MRDAHQEMDESWLPALVRGTLEQGQGGEDAAARGRIEHGRRHDGEHRTTKTATGCRRCGREWCDVEAGGDAAKRHGGGACGTSL